MVLARDLPSDVFGFSLVTTGQPLTQKAILRIHEIGIPGVYIQSGLIPDIDFNVDEIISPATQKKLITGIRKQFDDYYSQAVITDDAINCFYEMSADIVTSVLSKDYVFVNLVNIKRYDDYTYSHSAMVALVGTMIGTRLGMKRQELEALSTCGLMHDIGKMDIPLSIINKPARLTDEEMAIVRQHPSNAVLRLRDNRNFNCMVLRGIECHHEKYDGSGYPQGLVGENIHKYARIAAVADVFDALMHKRCYKDAWPL
ncbi:MAG: HD domain-containing protein, partial [Angelakisella sp.]